MERNNNDLDFITEVAKQISAKSQKSPINPDEILDVFKGVLDSMATAEIVEMPIFMPVIIEQEEDHMFKARSYGYPHCQGYGHNKEEAIKNFKVEINRYNQSYMNSEKKLRIEEMIKSIFPKDVL